MLSSDEAVTEEDIERGGVEVGVTTLVSDRALALASAWETAERYEAALAGRLDVDFVIFLNIECEGEAGLIAMGEGILGEREETPNRWSKCTGEAKTCLRNCHRRRVVVVGKGEQRTRGGRNSRK